MDVNNHKLTPVLWALWVGLSSFVFSQNALAQQPTSAAENKIIYVWHKNFRHEPTLAFLKLAMSKVEAEFGRVVFTPSIIESRQTAFASLVNKDAQLDIIVSAMNRNWEQQLTPTTFPLDRGLLGIRVCMIHPKFESVFRGLNTVKDFASQNIRILLGEDWSDIEVMKANGLQVDTFADAEEMTTKMRSEQAYCYSRSIKEVEKDLSQSSELKLEPRIALLYPLADVVYFSSSMPQLKDLFALGMQRALDDGSYTALFDSFFEDLLVRYGFYSRKMMFLYHPSITEEDRESLNRYGKASFLYGQY